MRHKASRELFAYWNALRAGRAAPERASIDPVAIRAVLGDVFILEVDAAATFPVSLSGERVKILFGHGLRGGSFVSLWAGEHASDIAGLCNHVCDDTVPLVAGLLAMFEHREPLPLELLLLPLRDNGKTHSRILGMLTPAHVPAWLGMARLRELSTVSMRIVQTPALPGHRRATFENSSLDQEDEERANLRAPVARRHAHLTVYQGGR